MGLSDFFKRRSTRRPVSPRYNAAADVEPAVIRHNPNVRLAKVGNIAGIMRAKHSTRSTPARPSRSPVRRVSPRKPVSPVRRVSPVKRSPVRRSPTAMATAVNAVRHHTKIANALKARRHYA